MRKIWLQIKTMPIIAVAMGIICFQSCAAVLYKITIGMQVLRYYDDFSFHNGIRYGLIDRNPLNLYPQILAISALLYFLITWQFFHGRRGKMALGGLQIVMLVVIIGTNLPSFLTGWSSQARTLDRMEVNGKVFYLVSKYDGYIYYRVYLNAYLLECDGLLGECQVLDSTPDTSARMEYDDLNRVIVFKSATQKPQECQISP